MKNSSWIVLAAVSVASVACVLPWGRGQALWKRVVDATRAQTAVADDVVELEARYAALALASAERRNVLRAQLRTAVSTLHEARRTQSAPTDGEEAILARIGALSARLREARREEGHMAAHLAELTLVRLDHPGDAPGPTRPPRANERARRRGAVDDALRCLSGTVPTCRKRPWTPDPPTSGREDVDPPDLVIEAERLLDTTEE